jgi:hypothetical protein
MRAGAPSGRRRVVRIWPDVSPRARALSALLTAAPALRGYGISALGIGPALIGVAAYLLLPLWRGLQT